MQILYGAERHFLKTFLIFKIIRGKKSLSGPYMLSVCRKNLHFRGWRLFLNGFHTVQLKASYEKQLT